MRFIGDPDARIREDYLRILRFFRFSARFGEGALDREGLSACVRHRSDLLRLSRERVRAEFLKLLVAERAAVVVRVMGERGILGELFGFADRARLERAVAVEEAAGLASDALYRLAALCVIVTEDATRLAERLRLSSAERERLLHAASALARLHGVAVAPGESVLRRLMFTFGRRGARDGLLLAQAETIGSDGAGFDRALRFLSETLPPIMPVRGKDILALGIPAGERVGEILQDFERLWVDADFPSDDDSVQRLIKAANRLNRS